MNQEERMTAIVDFLIDHSSVRIEQICDMFHVSKDTARRDLVRLEENNQIIRTRGGAMRSSVSHEIHGYHARLNNLTEEQKQIGKLAASFIQTGDRVILDSSSTVQTCASAMNHKECMVVTNSINQADILASYPAVNIRLLGGLLNKHHRYVYGEEALNGLAKFFVDKAFIGVVGVSEKGITVPHEEDADMKRKMINQAEITYVLADHTKIGKNDFVKVADLKDVDYIVTDRRIEGDFLVHLNEQGVEVALIPTA